MIAEKGSPVVPAMSGKNGSLMKSGKGNIVAPASSRFCVLNERSRGFRAPCLLYDREWLPAFGRCLDVLNPTAW
jgi:hypothetical protein